jgi:hypothetical protein
MWPYRHKVQGSGFREDGSSGAMDKRMLVRALIHPQRFSTACYSLTIMLINFSLLIFT